MLLAEALEILKAEGVVRLEVLFEGADGFGQITEKRVWYEEDGGPYRTLVFDKREAVEALAWKALALVPYTFRDAGGWGLVRASLAEDWVEASFRYRRELERSLTETLTLEDLEEAGLLWEEARRALREFLANAPQGFLAEGLLDWERATPLHEEWEFHEAVGGEGAEEIPELLVLLAQEVATRNGLSSADSLWVRVEVGEGGALVFTLEWTEWEREEEGKGVEVVSRKGRLSHLALEEIMNGLK
uniref:Uncharacterized protein n=1 Tax=Thermus caliditerrae TaxID=1330700 RepID=A0A7C5VJ49_9DEIN